MSEQMTGTLADLKTLVQGTPAAGDRSARRARRSATSRAVPTPPAAARTPWRASG